MSILEDDLLKRFDVVFRTVLVVTSVTISVAIAFYKEILPSYAFFYSIIPFLAAISIWAYSTLSGGTRECKRKISAWWTLMTAFTLLLARLIFSSFFLLPFVSTICLLVALMLTWPLFTYFRRVMPDGDELQLKIVLMVILLGVFIVDVISLIILLNPRFL
jgi:hypothetical protein